MGFFWMQRGGGRWTHNGVLDGICTRLTIDPATRTGVVVLTNGRCAEADARINAIEAAAFAAL
jgi:hypothetical protein